MIGALRHKIELLTAVRAADDGGGAGIIWAPGAEMWARVERLSSTQDFAGDRTARLKRIAATIRYQTNIALSQRLRFDGDVFEVVSIEDDEPGRRLTLVCEEAPL
jgi:SPP1 family predicted phage head-tail adaptor